MHLELVFRATLFRSNITYSYAYSVCLFPLFGLLSTVTHFPMNTEALGSIPDTCK